jgi:8-oxo-dGTP pyrophosphatase MutT (NUDIX family)
MTDLERPILYVTRVALWRDLNKEQILVGQRPSGAEGNRLKRSKNYPGRYEFPGGKFTPPNDPSLEAMRELKEEALLSGVRLFPPQQKLEHTYVMDEESSPYFGWLIYTHFTEAVALQQATLPLEPPEHDVLTWMTLEEIENLDLIPQSSFAVPYLREQQKLAQTVRKKTNR